MSEKKGFLASGAFKLIIAWVILGVILQVVIGKVLPGVEHQCEETAKELSIAIPEGGHGGHASHGAACMALVAEEEKRQEEADKAGTTYESIPGIKKFYAFLPLFHGMAGATAWNIPNFLIIITLIVHFVREPLGTTLKTRRSDLEKALGEAKKAKEDAEAKYKDYESRIKNIDSDIEAVKAEMRGIGEAEKKRILAEAEKLVERIKNDAEFTAKQELLVAQYKLKEDAAKLAVEIAEKVIKQAINDGDRERLLDEYLTKVRTLS